jgi:hypothetical protein
MPEGMEMPESHGHEELPFMTSLAVTLSTLAVLVALATLFGHRASTELLYSQSKVVNQWAYYQAKNMRLNEKQGVADLLGVLEPVDKEAAAALREKYQKEVERYSDEKDELSEKAGEYEKERELVDRRLDRYDASEVILEIGLIICSLTLLTRRKLFWYAGIGLGIVGLAVMISGFLVR